MVKRLISKITHNFGVKLLAIVIAVIVWYFAVKYSDPIDTKTYTVRIEVTNDSYIANGKQVYYIDDSNKSATVYISDNTSKLKNITENNISVVADLTQIVDLDRNPVMVPLTVSCTGVPNSKIKLAKQNIPITIENIASKELPITVSTGETTPNKDYEIGKLTPNISSITVSGPESIISQIDSVVAEINVTNLSKNYEKIAKLNYIDKQQNLMSQEIIDDDITIEGDVKEVRVDVELWKKRTGVTLRVNYSGAPLEGYQVYQITTSPDELTVAGTPEALQELENNRNVINIPADKVPINGASNNLTIEVDLTELLPEGLKVASSMNDTVTVYVGILPLNSREFKLDVDQIKTENLDPGYTVSYDQTTLTVRIKGQEEFLDVLTTDNIEASIDLTDMKLGDHVVPVSIKLPDGYQLVDDSKINIHIKTKATTTTTPANSQ